MRSIIIFHFTIQEQTHIFETVYSASNLHNSDKYKTSYGLTIIIIIIIWNSDYM